MSLVKGLDHIALKCNSKEQYKKAIHFYKDVLGFEAERSWEVATVFNTGSGLIEIFNNAEDKLPQGAIRHFALATDDVDKCAEICSEAGYEISVQPKDIILNSVPKFSARIAFCIGPVGEEIEFIQAK